MKVFFIRTELDRKLIIEKVRCLRVFVRLACEIGEDDRQDDDLRTKAFEFDDDNRCVWHLTLTG